MVSQCLFFLTGQAVITWPLLEETSVQAGVESDVNQVC